MRIIEYDRNTAVAYAKKWAYGRNPQFYNFDAIGGDCTNFASQCIYAGARTMNFTPVTGWFYRSVNDRTASWTGVEYLYRFLTGNLGAGPFGEKVDLSGLLPGDIVQLGDSEGKFYHSPVVCGIEKGEILVAAHSYDAWEKPLSEYYFETVRGIRIIGVRK